MKNFDKFRENFQRIYEILREEFAEIVKKKKKRVRPFSEIFPLKFSRILKEEI